MRPEADSISMICISHLQDADVYTQYEFYTCSRVSFARNLFSGIIIGVIGLSLVCALFMAFKTRKVHIKGLNDAKYITAIVYFSTLSEVLVAIAFAALRTYVNIFPVVVTGIFMITATFTLVAIFLPQVRNQAY